MSRREMWRRKKGSEGVRRCCGEEEGWMMPAEGGDAAPALAPPFGKVGL